MDLQKFLYEELDLIAQRSGGYVYSYYADGIIRQYSLFRKIARRIFGMFMKLLIIRKKEHDKNVFFLFFKFFDIITEEANFFNVIVGEQAGPRSLKNCWKAKKIHFLNTSNAVENLDLGYYSKNIDLSRRAVNYLVSQFKKHQVDIVILGHDKLFIERACILAARELNIPVVTFQHGIYTSSVDNLRRNKADKESTFFWCWSEHVKKIYLEAYNWPNDRVSVVGYPYKAKLEKYRKKRKQLSTPRVVFIGVYYSHFNEEDGNDFANLAKMVFDICNELGYDFVYRCHTGENHKEVEEKYRDIPNFKISSGRDPFDELTETSLLIGDLSSLMVEGALMGINSIQVLRDERFKEAARNGVYSSTYKVDYNREAIKHAMLSIMKEAKAPIIDNYELFLNEHIEENIRDEILKITSGFVNV